MRFSLTVAALKMPSLASGAAEVRTVNSSWEHKPLQTEPTKPRFEQHSSFSPFKVYASSSSRIVAVELVVIDSLLLFLLIILVAMGMILH